MAKQNKQTGSGKILEVVALMMRLLEESKDDCECTCRLKTGDIIDVCDACHAKIAFDEVYDYAMEHIDEYL